MKLQDLHESTAKQKKYKADKEALAKYEESKAYIVEYEKAYGKPKAKRAKKVEE